MITRNSTAQAARSAAQATERRQPVDRSLGVPAIVGVTFSFGQANSFTVLYPVRWTVST